MKIKNDSNSLMPYPVLSSFTDDYKNSSFRVDVQSSHSPNKMNLTIRFHLDNEQISKMINNGEALYLVHVESPKTSYREIRTSQNPEITLAIDAHELSDTVEVSTFIIAAQNIPDYCNSDFNELDAGYHFSLEKGNVIAIGTTREYEITRMKKISSLFNIQQAKPGRPANLYVDTDNDRIVVSISPTLWDLYYTLGKRKYLDTVFSLIYLPALVIVLARMCNDNGDLADYKWYQSICTILSNHGYSLSDLDIQTDSLLEAAQIIIGNPIARAFSEISENNEEGK